MTSIVGTLGLKFVGDTRPLDKSFGQVESRMKAFNAVAKRAFIGIGAAAAGAAALIVKGAQAYDVQAKAEASLLTALKGREDVQQRLLEQAANLQKVTLFGDEDLITQQAFLASLQLTEGQINKVLSAAVDLASGTDLSLNSAVKNLAKTYSGLTGELGEAIPQLRDLTTEQLKSGEAINVVASAFRGQAQAAAQADVSLTQVRNAFGDVLESVGQTFAPAIREANTVLLQLAQDAQTFFQSDLVQDFSIKAAAFIKTAFQSASSEVKFFILDVQKTFLGLTKFLAEQAAALAQNPLLDAFFSDEDLFRSLQNVGELSIALNNIEKEIFELEGTGNRFKDLYPRIFKEMEENAKKTTPAVSDLNFELTETEKGLDKTTKEVEDQTTALEFMTAGLRQIAGAYNAFKTLLSGEGINLGESFSSIDIDPDQFNISSKVAGGDLFSFPDVDTAAAEALQAQNQQISDLANNYGFLREQILAYFDTLEDGVEKTEAIAAANTGLASAALSVAAAVTSYAESGGDSLKEFANVAVAAAQKAIGAHIREGVTAAVKSALGSGVPFPFNIALAATAGAAAQVLFNKLINSIKVPALAEGGIALGPTLALIGEAGPEAVVPLSRGRGIGGSVTVKGVTFGHDTYWQNANVNKLGRLIHGPG